MGEKLYFDEYVSECCNAPVYILSMMDNSRCDKCKKLCRMKKIEENAKQ